MICVHAATRKAATELYVDLAARGSAAKKVHDSYVAFRERTGPRSRISIKAVLEAREG